MRVRCGTTRLVLLTGGRAIKIGRVRPLRLLLRMLVLPFSSRKRQHFLAKYGPSFWLAVRNDLLAGLYANRNEYRYYQEYHDPRVMPTIEQWMYGWIVVQVCGKPISTAEFSERPHIKKWVNGESSETAEPGQFCRYINGQIVLVDYGRQATLTALTTQ